MSFILDALRKSETDRQQQSTAEFASVPSSPPSAGVPRWLWIVGLLLAINVMVLVAILLQPEAESPAVASTDISSARSLPDTLIDQKASVEPPNFADQVATARQNRPETQAAPSAAIPDSGARDPVKAVLISQNPTAIPTENLYPSIQEVRANGLAELPELHLDIHVYNVEPNDRFVFINMSKLREGSTLTEGPVVTEITPDGVVLRHQGQSFLLPRE